MLMAAMSLIALHALRRVFDHGRREAYTARIIKGQSYLDLITRLYVRLYAENHQMQPTGGQYRCAFGWDHNLVHLPHLFDAIGSGEMGVKLNTGRVGALGPDKFARDILVVG